MKKILLVFVFILLFSNLCYANNIDEESQTSNTIQKHDAENLKNDVIKVLLLPQIKTAINAFYTDYLIDNPALAIFYMDIVNINHSNPDEGLFAWYDVTIDIMPFVGAHIPLGKDRLKFIINSDGLPQMSSFKHLETYDLSDYPNAKYHIAKPLPGLIKPMPK